MPTGQGMLLLPGFFMRQPAQPVLKPKSQVAFLFEKMLSLITKRNLDKSWQGE